jgi:D-amino-acid dehydrogenase
MKVTAPEIKDVWFGFRPCTPSGLPVIEKSAKLKNLIIATGHGMMGISLAPATGKLVAQLNRGENTSINLAAFSNG